MLTSEQYMYPMIRRNIVQSSTQWLLDQLFKLALSVDKFCTIF